MYTHNNELSRGFARKYISRSSTRQGTPIYEASRGRPNALEAADRLGGLFSRRH